MTSHLGSYDTLVAFFKRWMPGPVGIDAEFDHYAISLAEIACGLRKFKDLPCNVQKEVLRFFAVHSSAIREIIPDFDPSCLR